MLNRILLFIILLILFPVNQLIGKNNVSATDSLNRLRLENYNSFKKEYYSLLEKNQFKEIIALVSRSLAIDQVRSNKDSLYFDYMLQLISTTVHTGTSREAEKLLFELKKNIDPANHLLMASYYREQGYYFVSIKQYEDAIPYFDTAINESRLAKNSQLLGRNLYMKAFMLQLTIDRKAALPLFLEADKYIGNDEYFAMKIKQMIAACYSVQGQNNLALKYINQSILMASDNFGLFSQYDLPTFSKINNFEEFTSSIQMRSYIFREMAKYASDSLFYLNLALRDAEFSAITFEYYKNKSGYESDLLRVNNSYDYVYYKIIENIARLTDATHSDTLLPKALQYAEMDKISALLRSIQREQALNHSGIPDELVQQNDTLRKRLHELEAQRYQKQAVVRFDDIKLENLNLSFYEAIQELKRQESYLEENYPEYKRQKYQPVVPDLDFIYRLSHQKAIVEYVMSDKKLYTFLITDGQIHFYHTNYPPHFIESIDSLHQVISNGKELNFSLAEQTQFVKLSSFLYEQLIKPFEAEIKDKPLVIVPDGQLALIPFEVLLTDSMVPQQLNYQLLPYLVKQHDISYLYSLTLLEEQSKFRNRPVQQEVLAMAPEYQNLAGNKAEQYLAMRDARDNLGMLWGAKQEVKQIGRMLHGKSLFSSDATEEEFKKEGGKYSILHLAMHTLVNNEEPDYSKLVFTPDADKHEDGLLNTYELADLDLNADLVVLSACNTGFGKLNKGEGIIGLSRGFLKAGCKSLVATLWSVSDQTSMQVMKSFYKGLEREKDKSFSLSQAKRDYLASTSGMMAHPYYWSGYIVIGDTNPLHLNSMVVPRWAMVLIISSVLLLAYFGFRWWRYGHKMKAGVVTAGLLSN